MKARVLLLAFCAVVACRTLPSATPLADIGGAPAAPAANDRDRRSTAAVAEGAGGDAGEEIVVTAEATPPPASSAADAGAPDSAAPAPKSEPSAVAVSWPGEYYGSDRFVRRFDSGPEDVQVDDKARTRVEQPSPSSLVISVVNSLTGDVICALKAGVQGAEASLEPGQSCFEGEDFEAEVTSGRARLNGDVLTLDFEGKLGSEDDEVSGKDSYHFEGRRR